MATGELRERVRERLVSVEQGLARALGRRAVTSDDPVVALLATGSRRPGAVPARPPGPGRGRLRRRHHRHHPRLLPGGAGRARRRRRRRARRRPSSRTCRDLVDEVVDDLYVRRFHGGRRAGARRCAQASEIARVAIENPGAEIVTRRRATSAQMRRRLAEAVREEFEDRKRRLSVMTYDDLVTRLQAALCRSGRRGGRLRGCDAASASCWSTSSRTPTRSSGTSCAGPSATAGDHPGADRRPQAGHLRLPGRRRLRLPGGRRERLGPRHPRRQLAQRPGPDRRPRRPARRRQARASGHRLPARQAAPAHESSRLHGSAAIRRRCASGW